MKTCTNCPGATDHDTAHCPLRGVLQAYDAWRNSPTGYVRPYDPGEWEAWQAASALAQPSPKRATCNDNGRIGGPSFYAPDEGGEPCPYTGFPKPTALMGSNAQPSPEPRLERPEMVEFDWPEYHAQGMGCGLEDRGITDRYEAMQYGWDCALDRCAEVVPNEPLMTVAQHARVIAQWADLFNRSQDRADAAKARVAELVAALERAATAMWNSEANMDNEAAAAEEAIGNAKSATPVAQAGQVPEELAAKINECLTLAFEEIALYVSPDKCRDPRSRARRASALATEIRAAPAQGE